MGRASKSSKDAVAVEAADEAIANEPESVRLVVKLPPKQRAAIQGYRAGCGNAEAAKLADVDPSTISRWLTHDAKFIAAHNAVILENVKSANAEAASLLPLATAAIRKQLEKGNGWLALQFYREAKSIGALDIGPTSAAAVKKELKLAQQTHENELLKKELLILQQQQEIEKLRIQVESAEDENLIEKAQEEGFWYAWMAFYHDWSRERGNPHARHHAQIAEKDLKSKQHNEKSDRAEREHTQEKTERLIAEADRLQRVDQEKKQRGERVKSAGQQADDLRDKYGPANLRRTRELEQQEQQEQQRKAEQAAEQPSSQSTGASSAASDGGPLPGSPKRETISEVDRWYLEHEEAEREADEEESKLEDDEAAAKRDHPAADAVDKSNPDVPPLPSASDLKNPSEPATASTELVDEDDQQIINDPADPSGSTS